jgi:pectate lyase
MNGAYFISSGATSVNAQYYAKAATFNARPVNMVESMTAESGPILCVPAVAC